MNLWNEMEEQFKPIKGFEGLYEVSNLGRVKSLIRNIILKPSYDKTGYHILSLYKGKKHNTKTVHRLIAMGFIQNLENKPEVNHINGIKSDNRIENLEWATRKENVNHAHMTGLCDARIKTMNKQTIDLYTGIIFNSLKQACESLNLKSSTERGRMLNKNYNNRLQYI